jgi:regulator of protease activity HflC (stomatin/prohibitin superfamily)
MNTPQVLDANGNPILVSAILTYKFINSKRALLNVANPYEYVTQQATTVLKQVWRVSHGPAYMLPQVL